MRLLYLSADRGVPVLGHKGASIHLRELCVAFVGAGVEVHIASPRTTGEGDALAAPASLHNITPLAPEAHLPATFREAVRAQAEEVTELAAALRVDAIYERFSLFSAAGVRSARALGVPHVLEVNAPLREEAQRYRILLHPEAALAAESEVMGETDCILAVSAPLAAALARGGADPAKIAVSPNGVAAERFAPSWRDPARFVVGFVGSLKPWHGVETLVEAVCQVPEAHLEVVGKGPLDNVLRRMPIDRITRRGGRSHAQTIALMAGWDVGVAPYAPVEGFWFSPLKVLEYMAAGTCPVASDLGDARELLGDGRRGVLVPAGDAAALASAIGALAHDRERARRLGDRAREWVAVNRSWSLNVDRALAALERRAARQAA